VTILTLAGFLITYLEIRYWHRSTGYLLIISIQAILLFSAFIPHLMSTIGFRMYSPGVITAVLLTLPFSYYLFHRHLPQFYSHSLHCNLENFGIKPNTKSSNIATCSL
jgi:hypothetical protein